MDAFFTNALEAARRRWPIIAGAFALAMLAAAHGFERIGGLEPCALCLRQREVYWAILAIAAVGLVLAKMRPTSARAVDALLGGAFLTGAVVAAFHAGVEWHWWPGPDCIGGQGGVSGGDLSDMFAEDAGAQGVVACDLAAWRDPIVHLSMAGWNALLSLDMAAASLLVALRPRASIGELHD